MIEIDKDTNAIKMVAKDTGVFVIDIENYELGEGDTVHFTVNDKIEDQNPKIHKTITQFTEGSALVSLNTTDTNLPIGTYWYDVQVNLASGEVDTIIGPAKFKIVGGITY